MAGRAWDRISFEQACLAPVPRHLYTNSQAVGSGTRSVGLSAGGTWRTCQSACRLLWYTQQVYRSGIELYQSKPSIYMEAASIFKITPEVITAGVSKRRGHPHNGAQHAGTARLPTLTLHCKPLGSEGVEGLGSGLGFREHVRGSSRRLSWGFSGDRTKHNTRKPPTGTQQT